MVASLVVPSVRESFPAYVAHELRTPLATQRVLLELALADPGTDAATWRETGEELLRACRQQERLLESCLTLARSKDGPRRRDPIDLATIAAEALRAQDPGALERVVVLEPAPTTGDPVLTERLVANLVSNAIRHNVSGGRIEVATRTETGRAVLSVTNTGPPIPARDLDRLFQPFHRLDASPRCLNDGVGLGLAIVRAIADAHEALLTARARTGGGLAIDVSYRTAN
jgi:signal transduction histidine kinase